MTLNAGPAPQPPAVVLYLSGGQTVRLPLRRRGRGWELAPRGYTELDEWVNSHPDVLQFRDDAIIMAVFEPETAP